MSSLSSHRYDIQRLTGHCAATEKKLAPGETYIATLVEAENEGFERLDFSLQAWEQGSRPEGLFCFWKSVVTRPEEKKKPLVDETVMMDLLKRLDNESDPRRLAFRFVLALLLMRKKLLRYEKTVVKQGPVIRPVLDAMAEAYEQAQQAVAEQAQAETPSEDTGENNNTADSPASIPEPQSDTQTQIIKEADTITEETEGQTEQTQVEPDSIKIEIEIADCEYWLMTPKLDPAKGPMGKWDTLTLEVLDPHLTEGQLRLVSEQLGEILNTELNV